jgi:outer membrane protein TolC
MRRSLLDAGKTWTPPGDAIHQHWNTVVAGIARSRAARAGRQAAFEAAAQAQIRYAVGNVTQLDLLQAQRDALIAA